MTVTKNNEHKRLKHKRLIIVLSCILAFILILISSFFIFLKIGEIKLRNKLSNTDTPSGSTLDEDNDSDVYYNGQKYSYNSDLINILFIGVDKKNIDTKGHHQADALYLASLNVKNSEINMVALSRNTIAKIDVYDIKGNYFSTDNRQICLAYSFGKDDIQSSELTVKAVSNYLYNIPINGYYTIFTESVGYIVNSVGGVKVDVKEDLTKISPDLKPGNSVLLKGDKALRYLRYRTDSNVPRLERQKEFISSFVKASKKAVMKDLSLPIKMFDNLSSNTVTDVSANSAAYLASEAAKSNFHLKSIKGSSGFDGQFETFSADENQLQELLMDVFYIKQN